MKVYIASLCFAFTPNNTYVVCHVEMVSFILLLRYTIPILFLYTIPVYCMYYPCIYTCKLSTVKINGLF